uniref:Uncharacterized protein n=1 Tax=Homalodisca liturata TaxID=320908 RepID=A0A1B6HEJ3_9HEMI
MHARFDDDICSSKQIYYLELSWLRVRMRLFPLPMARLSTILMKIHFEPVESNQPSSSTSESNPGLPRTNNALEAFYSLLLPRVRLYPSAWEFNVDPGGRGGP